MSTNIKGKNHEDKKVIDFPLHQGKAEQDGQHDDQLISALVNSVRAKVPDGVEKRINEAIEQSSTGELKFSRRPYRWFKISMTAAAAVILVLTAAIFQSVSTQKVIEKPAIAEIKTEIELSNKNIKILWVHKKDFKLRP